VLKIRTFMRHNAIALVALFVALGGTSYAALVPGPGSVGTKQLRNGAVTNKKLAKHAVTAASLDPKSIAGHIAEWAQIRANGQVISSRPRASVSLSDPSRGLFKVSWHQAIPRSCMAMASAANVPTVVVPATADTFGPYGQGRGTSLLVETFNPTAGNVPMDVNVAVICP
jgi:hypothetical protein